MKAPWIFTIIVLFVIAVAPAFAADGDSELVPLLETLFEPGALGFVAGLILSYVADVIPAYKEQSPRAKRLYFFLACFVIGVLGGVAIGALKGDLNWDHVIAAAFTATVTAIVTGTAAHTRELPAE